MSGYIGVLPVPQTTQTRESFTATNGQTSFGTSGYQIDHLDVYLNGVKLAAADFTATNGSDIVLATGAALNDILEMVAFETFTIANQSFTGTTTVDTLVVTNTVDGRDVSVDGAKLDTIPIVSTSSTPSFTAKGDGSSQDGYIQLNCSQNSHGIKLKAPPHSANASYTLTFPNDDGNANQFLKTDGSGVLSWATDSTTDSTKLPLAGGAMTGAITTNSTFDGVDVATRDAVLTSTTTTAGAALPKAGGALTGAVTTNSTFDGVDIATRDAVLTSTTTTANAALPKAGGAMTGVLSVSDGSVSSPSIANTGDLDTGISFPAINSIAISTAGTQRLVIDSAGFFDVSATGNDVARFSGLNSGSLVIRNDTANQVIMHTGTSDSLVFGTGGNNDRLTIDAAGAATFSGTLGVSTAANNYVTVTSTNNNTRAGYLSSSKKSDGTVVKTWIRSEEGGIGSIFTETNHNLGFATNNAAPQMTLSTSGNLGIGTNSPSAKIDVVTNDNVFAAEFTQSNTSNGDGVSIVVGSTAAADYALTVRSNAGNTSGLAVKADGKVGIGVFSPSARGQLQVHNTTDNGRAAIQLTSNETGAGANNGFAIQVTPNAANGDKSCSLTQFENADMLFHTNNEERMRLSNLGQVNIRKGSAAIVTPLQFDGLVIQNTDATGIRIISDQGNGNVGHAGIGVDNGALTISAKGQISFDTGFLPSDQLYTGRVERFNIASGGDVTVKTGDLIFGTAGKGVVLGATTNVAANTLDDYEEGTYTLSDQSGAGLSITVYVATYTKIGNQVFFEFGIVFPTTSNTADIKLRIPFVAKSSGDNTGGGAITTTTSGRNDSVAVGRNTQYLFVQNNLNQGATNANYSGKQLRVAGQYTTP